MMHMTKGWSGLRTAVIALSLFAWTTTGAKADAMPSLLDYSTAGTIGTTGVSGNNVISFVPVGTTTSPYATVDPNPGSNIALGAFQVAALNGNQTTTYTNTPFQINFIPNSFGGEATGATPVTLTGKLNGEVTGNYQSSVKVSFDPVTPTSNNLPFELGAGVPTALVSATGGGTSTLEATITSSGSPSPSSSSGSGSGPNNESPAPEPSTIALFLSTIGGLGLRRYVMSRRRQNKA
jgi:hypothetical protein